jgi:hypothetical protein
MVGVAAQHAPGRARAEELNPFRALSTFHTGDDTGLEALAGLSVGATFRLMRDGHIADAAAADYVRYPANLRTWP